MPDPVITEMPTKPAIQSNSMWASVLTIVIGFATSLGLSQELAEFFRAQVNDIVGIALTLVGMYGAYATARRKTAIKL